MKMRLIKRGVLIGELNKLNDKPLNTKYDSERKRSVSQNIFII